MFSLSELHHEPAKILLHSVCHGLIYETVKWLGLDILFDGWVYIGLYINPKHKQRFII